MTTQEILKNIREKHNLTQDQMAERIHVTRQAVSRWETGETQPNTEMLKVLSREFNVSINTLLGAPRQLFCQCCGMPLGDDAMISRENRRQLQRGITASGAMPTASSPTPTKIHCWTFCFRTCLTQKTCRKQKDASSSTRTFRN